MVDVGRDFCWLSCPAPLLKQPLVSNQLLKAMPAVGLLRALSCGLENLQGCRLYRPSGQTVPLLDCPQGENDFPSVQTETHHTLVMRHFEEHGFVFLITTLQILGGCFQVLKQSVLHAEQALIPRALLMGKVLCTLTISVFLCQIHSSLLMSPFSLKLQQCMLYSRHGLVSVE